MPSSVSKAIQAKRLSGLLMDYFNIPSQLDMETIRALQVIQKPLVEDLQQEVDVLRKEFEIYS